MKITDYDNLKEIANNIRIDIIEEIYNAKSGHPGGALSIADILSVLYFNQMNVDNKNSKLQSRDRLVLSKGHASAALYAALAEKGYYPKEQLKNFRKLGSNLQGHPDMNKLPGVDMTSGSLGQGLSVSNGMAIAAKLDKNDCRIYCILGDGEMEEGQIWEAAMTSNKYKLDNLCVILDNNGLQIDGKIENVKSMSLIKEKWEAFGFNVIEVDGHNIEELIEAFEKAKDTIGKPSIIIANTIKGKGISYMENEVQWHGKAPNDEEYELAMKELKSIK